MFMQLRGKLFWQCPGCLYINKHTMVPLRYKLKCTNSKCVRVWNVGMILFASNMGRNVPPPDLIAMDGGRWRGGRIHKVLCDSCSTVLFEHQPPPVAPWIELPKRQLHHEGFAEVALEKEEEEEADGLSEDS